MFFLVAHDYDCEFKCSVYIFVNISLQELRDIDHWGGVNLFKLSKLSNGRPLVSVLYHIMEVRVI